MSTTQGQQYTLNFTNNTSAFGSAILFQTDDLMFNAAGMLPVVWLCSGVLPLGAQTGFTWNTDYSFVWAETGTLVPGVVFSAAQVMPADLTQGSLVTFAPTGEENKFAFSAPLAGMPGQLVIQEDPVVPPAILSVGIGMSGSVCFATQVIPNTNIVVYPQPQYWVGFGAYSQGEVLDGVFICTQIDFPSGQSTANVVLTDNNTFTFSVSYS